MEEPQIVETPITEDTAPTGKPDGWSSEHDAFVSRIVAKEVGKAVTKARIEAEDAAREKAVKDAERVKRKAAEERGEYETVKQSLESERDAVVTERDALRADVETLTRFFDAQYTEALDGLPKPVLAFRPGDEATISEKAAFLERARKAAADLPANPARGNGPDPMPQTASFDMGAETAKAARRLRI